MTISAEAPEDAASEAVRKFGITVEDYMLPARHQIQMVGPDGTLNPHTEQGTQPGHEYALPGDEELMAAYEQLVVGRRVNDQNSALVRQGRMAVYPSSHGQEACQVAAALCLSDGDWMFPTYRDSVAVMARGVDPVQTMTLFRGDWHGGYDPAKHKVGIQCTPLTTQLLHGVGVAHAAKLRGEDTVVLAMCGDGATSEGDFHEALNFAAVFHLPVVFFVQNNQYAISVPLASQSVAPSLAHKAVGYGMAGERVDGNDIVALLAVLGRAVKLAREGSGPLLVEAHTYRMQAHTNADDATRYRQDSEVADWVAKDPLSRMNTYLTDRGLLDDDRAARIAEKAEAVATQLREGLSEEVPVEPQDLFKYVFSTPTPQLKEQSALLADELARDAASTSTAPMQGVRQMSPTITTSSEANGNVSAATARAAAKAAIEAEKTGPQTITLAKALNTAMADAMHADESVLVFGEDVGMLGGVFRITDGLTKTFGKNRCFDTPLAESGIVGMAVGMAMNGMRPVIEMQFDAFAYPAFEQIVSHVAKMHNRTKGTVKLPIVIRVPYAGGIGGVEHHCDSSEAYYAHTAGLKVFTPATVADGYRMLREAIDSDDPVMFMEPKKLYWSKDQVDLDALRAEHTENTERGTSSEGRAAVARPGTDATLIAYGPSVPTALAAAAAAAEEGRSLEVIDVRSIVPFDDETVCASVRKTGRAVVIAEAHGFASVSSEIVARVQERCFHHLAAPIRRVTGFDVPYPAPKLEHYYLPGVDRILDAVDDLQWED